ncbi:MAG: hypothetical protein J0I06_12680 [Planctomycetes bacterium]|nr:hypothetical protein [Planctomycetota bacterium]
MRIRPFAPLLVLLLAALPARAAVVVVANYTTEPVAFSVAEPGAKAREHKVAPNDVAPVFVTGPADIAFTAKGKAVKLRFDPYTAGAFLPDEDAGVRLEGIKMPGNPLERDLRPELNPVPRDPPVKVPVTLLVDDADPRGEKLWQKELRARFEEAAGPIEKAAGIRLELVGFDTWRSDAGARNTSQLLTGFENAVKVKPGALAVGYSSRAVDEKLDPSFGVTHGAGSRRVLLREGRPLTEPQRVEVLTHFLAKALGAVGSPDPGSAMRAKLDDEYILRAGAVLRLDPLNALALNIWADERRRDPAVEIATLSPVNRERLTRVYKTLLDAAPGDVLATRYLGELDRDFVKPAEPVAPKGPDRKPLRLDARDELVRVIVAAVAARAKKNASLGASGLTGDALTAAYVRAAAEVALARSGPETVSAFSVALGVALDDTGALSEDEATAAAVRAFETPEDRKTRVAALGNPTLGGRRDLCRRFALGCATGELLAQSAAENRAVARALLDLRKPVGLCVPALAAECSGIAFAAAARNDPEMLRDVTQKFTAAEYLPPLTGLRNGLSAEKFAEVYGGATDERFVAVLVEIRVRVRAMRAYR